MKSKRTNYAKQKSIGTKKDTTIAIETRAGVIKDNKPTIELFLQFAGREYADKDILEKVKKVWTQELQKPVDEMKSVQIYLKPEECMAYYVINEETTGKVEL